MRFRRVFWKAYVDFSLEVRLSSRDRVAKYFWRLRKTYTYDSSAKREECQKVETTGAVGGPESAARAPLGTARARAARRLRATRGRGQARRVCARAPRTRAPGLSLRRKTFFLLRTVFVNRPGHTRSLSSRQCVSHLCAHTFIKCPHLSLFFSRNPKSLHGNTRRDALRALVLDGEQAVAGRLRDVLFVDGRLGLCAAFSSR